MEAQNFAPNIVVIRLGTNDAYPNNQQTKVNFIKDYEALVKEFQILSSAPQIWLVKPPPVFRNGKGISTEFFTVNITPAIETVAAKLNLQVRSIRTVISLPTILQMMVCIQPKNTPTLLLKLFAKH